MQLTNCPDDPDYPHDSYDPCDPDDPYDPDDYDDPDDPDDPDDVVSRPLDDLCIFIWISVMIILLVVVTPYR